MYQTIRASMHRLHERSAKGLFRHDATSWMDLVPHLDTRIHGPVSGCPAVVMVESTHDRKSNHFAPCILRGRNRSAPFRYPLRNPLVRSLCWLHETSVRKTGLLCPMKEASCQSMCSEHAPSFTNMRFYVCNRFFSR